MNNLTYRSLVAVAVVVMIAINSFAAGNAVGNWEGKIAFNEKSKAEIKVNLVKSDAEKLAGTIVLPGQKNESLVLQNVRHDGAQVSFDLIDGRTTASFNGTLTPDGESLKGEFAQAGRLFPFELSRCQSKLTAESSTNAELDKN